MRVTPLARDRVSDGAGDYFDEALGMMRIRGINTDERSERERCAEERCRDRTPPPTEPLREPLTESAHHDSINER